MPAASSVIRTVPDGKVGPAGGSTVVTGGGSAMTSSPESATRKPISTTSTRASTPRMTASPVRPPGPDGAGGGTTGSTGRGVYPTGCWTFTPGPAGVATSDQLTPFHQRTRPGAPSGSGYQPGAMADPSGRLTDQP